MCLGELGKVERTWDEGGIPMASIRGKAVCLIYTPDAVPGDFVMAHLGYVMEIIDEQRAESAVSIRNELADTTRGREDQ